jgi:hypothetical protein
MNDPKFDRSAFPSPLATIEDYEKGYQDFVRPFLANRAGIVNDLIEKLQKITEQEDWEVDEALLTAHVEAVKKASNFPEDVNEFLTEIVALERKLESEGVLDEES